MSSNGLNNRKKNFVDVIERTETIHGFKYIADKGSSKPIRIFWIFSFVLSICCFGYYAHKMYVKLFIEPEVGMNIKAAPAMSVPFPALTFCYEPRINKSLNDVADEEFEESCRTNKCNQEFLNGSSFTEDDFKEFEAYQQFCTFLRTSSTNLKSNEIVKFLSDTQSQKLNIKRFKFRFKFYFKWHKIFDRILTHDGFCFTFNLEDYSKIFNEGLSKDFDSYKINKTSNINELRIYDKKGNEAYPWRLLVGKKNHTEIRIFYDKGDSIVCGSHGVKLYIHSSNEIPSKQSNFIKVDVKNKMKINMRATKFSTNSNLMAYRPDQRGCLTDSDNYLKFFKSYTKSNCELECWTNFTLKECGCVKFFMPRDEATEVCDVMKLKCVEDAEDAWLLTDKASVEETCTRKCLKACNYVEYEQVNFMKDELEYTESHKKNFPNSDEIAIEIHFQDYTINHHEYYLAYRVEDFASDCGGLLGLFMGCSLLSLVEISYHLICILFTKKKRQTNDEEMKQMSVE